MDGEYALISLKPDAYRRGMKKMILKTCKKAGLRVKYHKNVADGRDDANVSTGFKPNA